MVLLELDDAFAQRCRDANAAVKAARAAMQIASPFQINAALGAIIKANNEQATLAIELIKLVDTASHACLTEDDVAANENVHKLK